jgi:hypothetical protein
VLVAVAAPAATAATAFARFALLRLLRSWRGLRCGFRPAFGSWLRPLPLAFGPASLMPALVVMALPPVLTAAALLGRSRSRGTFRPAAAAFAFPFARAMIARTMCFA